MKKLINRLASDKIIFIGTMASIMLLLMSIVVVAFYFQGLPPYIPLYHQIPWGVERLAKKIEFFLPCLYVFTIISVNIAIAFHVYEKMPLVSRIIAITNILLSLILFIFTLRTIQLII